MGIVAAAVNALPFRDVRGTGAIVFDRARLPQSNTRTESDLRDFADALARVVLGVGGVDVRVLDGQVALAALGADAFCDDGVICTDDTCTAGACTNAPRVGPCDDGDACTTGETCAASIWATR